jgi:hypothetical protein
MEKNGYVCIIKKKRLGLGVVKRARPDLPHHFWRSVPKFKLDSFS